MRLQLNVRIMMIFFVGTALLNVINYSIYAYQSHKYSKPGSSKTPKPTSRVSIWDALITCSGVTSRPQATASPGGTIKISPEITPKVSLEDIEKVSADSSFEYTDSSTVMNSVTEVADLCPDIPMGLGPITSSEDLIESVTNNTFGEIFKGGYYKTTECRPRQSVAVIVAHRGDKKLLKLFLYYLHSFLIKQQSEYQIYVVENANQSAPFNRGQLFNIGFSEVQRKRKRDWSCIILHEAYLIPTDIRNLYRCAWYPKQLVAVVGTSMPDIQPKIGGVVAVSPQIYSRVNGFSNLDWKSDTEYTDFYQRILLANCTVERSDINIGKYRYIKFMKTENNSSEAQTTTFSPLHIADGLSYLSYKADIEYLNLYTHINATINAIAMETLDKFNLLLGRGIRRRTTPMMPSSNI